MINKRRKKKGVVCGRGYYIVGLFLFWQRNVLEQTFKRKEELGEEHVSLPAQI
jgi:hypothetical protein